MPPLALASARLDRVLKKMPIAAAHPTCTKVPCDSRANAESCRLTATDIDRQRLEFAYEYD